MEGAARGPVSGRGMRRTAPGSRGEKGSPVRRQFPEGGGDLKYNIGLDLEPIKRNGRTITRNPAESRLQSKGRSARLRVFTSARVAHWAQSPSKRANLNCAVSQRPVTSVPGATRPRGAAGVTTAPATPVVRSRNHFAVVSPAGAAACARR